MSRPSLLLLILSLCLLGAWWSLDRGETVAAGSPGWTPVPKEVGTLSGRVLVDPLVPVERLRVDLDFYVARTTGLSLHLPLDVDEGGLFATPELPPGIAQLAVAVGGTTIAHPKRMCVEAGALARVELDLRGLVHVFELLVEDGAGQPIEGGVVGWRASAPEDGGSPYACWSRVHEGRATVFDASPVIDVLVQPARGAVTEFPGLTRSRTIQVSEPWLARVFLPPDVDPEIDGTRLEILVRRERLDPRIARARSLGGQYYGDLDPIVLEGEHAWLELPAPGPWILEWRATAQGERLDLGRSSARVTLERGDGSEDVTPAFPLEAYRRALAER